MKNPQLKRAYSQDSFTAENIQVLKKCMKDPIFFIQTYIKIQHPVTGLIPFILYEYQIEMVNEIHNNRKTILLCSRQLGKCLRSTTTINIAERPTGIRRWVLWQVDRKTHNDIFSDSS